jgi:hypothetical protein
MRLDWLQLRVRTHKSPFYLQAAREQPVTLALLPVESCEMLWTTDDMTRKKKGTKIG